MNEPTIIDKLEKDPTEEKVSSPTPEEKEKKNLSAAVWLPLLMLFVLPVGTFLYFYLSGKIVWVDNEKTENQLEDNNQETEEEAETENTDENEQSFSGKYIGINSDLFTGEKDYYVFADCNEQESTCTDYAVEVTSVESLDLNLEENKYYNIKASLGELSGAVAGTSYQELVDVDGIKFVDDDLEMSAKVEKTNWNEVSFSQDFLSTEMTDLRVTATFELPQNWTLEETNFREGQGYGNADCYDYIIKDANQSVIINISPYCASSYQGSEPASVSADRLTIINKFEQVGDDNHNSYIVRYSDRSNAQIGEVMLEQGQLLNQQETVDIYSIVSIPTTDMALRTEFDDQSILTTITISDGADLSTVDTIIASMIISNIETLE